MRRIAQTLAVAIVLAAAAAPAAAQPKPDSLYKRIGGYDAIAAVVDDFVPRLVKDPMLAKYFVHSQDTLMHIRQLAVDQSAHRGALRLHRPRHEDGPQGARHQRCGMGSGREASHGDARSVQGAGGGERRAAESG